MACKSPAKKFMGGKKPKAMKKMSIGQRKQRGAKKTRK